MWQKHSPVFATLRSGQDSEPSGWELREFNLQQRIVGVLPVIVTQYALRRRTGALPDQQSMLEYPDHKQAREVAE